LVNELRRDVEKQIETNSQLPLQAEYTFDPVSCSQKPTNEHMNVQKTVHRTVVSLHFSKFEAKEVVREQRANGKTTTFHCPELRTIVPSGARYAYDMISFVGIESYLKKRRLNVIHEELKNQCRSVNIPFSSLYDLQRKFLFYVGALHRQAAPVVKDYLDQRGNNTWLIDGTIEPGSPVFFGVKEASEGIFLDGWKIPSENENDISQCLIEASRSYGQPDEILHDLSEAMFNSCEIAFPKVAHRVCQYHLASDVGKDLYKVPQEMLNKRIRAMKFQLHLNGQRSGQTQWLRGWMKEKQMPLILSDLLNGAQVTGEYSDSLWREVLLGLHGWMLDYSSDGHRQGFPFDPYLLYFHRRIVTAHKGAKRLLAREDIRKKLPKVLFNFSNKLEQYLTDPVIVQATDLYEKAFDIFEQIRCCLRLCAKGPSPMHESYELYSEQQDEVRQSLDELRKQITSSMSDCSDSNELKLYNIVQIHFDKYEPYLFPAKTDAPANDRMIRTTNRLESHWSQGKRGRRQTHGRRKLTRDFQALPAEYMLVPNLTNERYVEIVFDGSLERLAEKLAEAGKTAGPYSAWYKRQKPLNIGRLPARLLREKTFVDKLIDLVCNS